MNINLAYVNPPESLQDRIDEHLMVMGLAGFPVTGAVALVAEDQTTLPGSYRVWLRIILSGSTWWVWVDDEGRVHRTRCPISGTLALLRNGIDSED